MPEFIHPQNPQSVAVWAVTKRAPTPRALIAPLAAFSVHLALGNYWNTVFMARPPLLLLLLLLLLLDSSAPPRLAAPLSAPFRHFRTPFQLLSAPFEPLSNPF